MSTFSMPVHWYMSAPVHTVGDGLDVNALHHRFIKLNVSSLPVIDVAETLVGVVSRTDVLRATFQKKGPTDAPLLTVPDRWVTDIMSRDVLTVDFEDSVDRAAAIMIENGVHRVFVTKDGNLAGVLSARDVLPAVVDLRLQKPTSQFMSTPLFVIGDGEKLDSAMTILEQAQISGVVILGEAGPMGVFTQAEALQCRNLPRNARVTDAMDRSIITLHTSTPMHRAAEQAIENNSRRLVVIDENDVRGILTPLDFVRAVE